jgi:hypothetical protein
VDDPDLQLLREFRASEAEPPAGMQERIEERLWRAIIDEEAAKASRSRPRRPWYEDLLRPAVAAGAAAMIALGVAVVGGGTDGGASIGSGSSVSKAGVFDATAGALFGESGATSATSTPIVGAIDVGESSDDDDTLARGPVLGADGALDEATTNFINDTTRDPQELQPRLIGVADRMAGSEQADRVAFHMAMRWVVSPQVPADLRASMLRALQGVQGIDGAIAGVDQLGRSGIVVGQLDQDTGLRTQYLLDPEGGRLLEQRTFMAGYVDPACPPGTFTSHTLYGEDGRPIAQADAPWIGWPLVIAACDPMAAAA